MGKAHPQRLAADDSAGHGAGRRCRVRQGGVAPLGRRSAGGKPVCPHPGVAVCECWTALPGLLLQIVHSALLALKYPNICERRAALAVCVMPDSNQVSAKAARSSKTVLSCLRAHARATQEEIARRLEETQRLMARFGQENERLASEISRMRSGGAGASGAPSDYKGAAQQSASAM